MEKLDILRRKMAHLITVLDLVLHITCPITLVALTSLRERRKTNIHSCVRSERILRGFCTSFHCKKITQHCGPEERHSCQDAVTEKRKICTEILSRTPDLGRTQRYLREMWKESPADLFRRGQTFQKEWKAKGAHTTSF